MNTQDYDEIVFAIQNIDALLYAYEAIALSPDDGKVNAQRAECILLILRKEVDRLMDQIID